MGKLKDILQEEKKNMPEYQYNFLYKKVMPGLIFVLGGAVQILLKLSIIHTHRACTFMY